MNQKTKKIIIPSIYALSLVAFALSIYFIQKVINNNMLKSDDNNLKYVDQEIINTNEVVPVVSADTKIIRPYLAKEVTIAKSFYDYQAESTNQEKALILFEDTYIQNSGVDYIKNGTFDIVSVLDGTVINITNDNILGTTIEIRHSNEIISVYQSLDNITVKQDDQVLQGQIIGVSGKNNINAELKEHLHFELFYKGMIVNPEEYYDKNIEEL